MSVLQATLSTLSDLGSVIAAPDPGNQAPPGADQFLKVGAWIRWGAGLVAVIGLIAVAAVMAIQHHRGTTGEHGGKLAAVAVASVIIGIAPQLVSGLGA